MEELPRGTVTFLFTDIEGSTELTRRLGATFGDVRAQFRRLVREAVARHRGHEIDTEGDGFFAAFDRASDAVEAAVAAQRALAAADWPEAGAVAARMGLHTAEPYLHADGYIGVGVSRAARICAAGHGGQILLSHATAGIAEDLDVPGVRLRELGQFRLKDIPRPQRLVQLDIDGLPTDFLALRATGRAGSVASLVLTDVAGWQQIMTTLGDDAAAVVAVSYHRLVGSVVRDHRGIPHELLADNTLSLFDSAKDAVVAALAVRDALREADWFPSSLSPGVRIGVHTGRISDPDTGQLGSSALRAGRVCDAAEPWGVLISHSTHALLEGEALEGVVLRDLGERRLSGGELARVFEAVAATAG